ncbi:MAG: sensor histidine kinase [Anaerolineaceae bacterium]|jgi:signal transduction histidine kinase
MRNNLILGFTLVIILAMGTLYFVATAATMSHINLFFRYSSVTEASPIVQELQSYYLQAHSWEGVREVFITSSELTAEEVSRGITRSKFTLLDDKYRIVYSEDTANIGNHSTPDMWSNSVPIVIPGKTIGYLLPGSQKIASLEEITEQVVDVVGKAILSTTLITSVIAFLIATIITYRFVRPINDMIVVADNIAQGDLSQRVITEQVPELEQLGNSLNKMASALQIAEKNRRSLTADIAHELRTPLAIQKANIEAIEDGLYPLEIDSLRPIQEQNELLSRLVNDLRLMALADSGELRLNMAPTDINQVCESVVNKFEVILQENNLTMVKICPNQIPLVMADHDRLGQIMHNLLQNAVRYGGSDSTIEITSSCDGDMIMLSMRDHGPGIPKELLNTLFERFRRGDPSRQFLEGSTGLGLSIARKLAEAHGGSLTAHNHPEGGAVFTLRIPIIPPGNGLNK